MASTIARRALVAGAAALGMVLVPSAAFAHDCIQVSRSERGNIGAANSQAWISFSVADIVASEDHDEETTACILDGWAAAGGPSYISIHVKGANGAGGVVSGKNPNAERHSDGRGIDLFSAWVPVIAGVYDACDADFDPEP